MVIEGIVISKLLDGLINWHKNNKSDKEMVKRVLKKLKIALDSITLHMDLSVQYGHLMPKKLSVYFPSDIEHLRQTILENEENLDYELSSELLNFLKYLVEYNQILNSL